MEKNSSVFVRQYLHTGDIVGSSPSCRVFSSDINVNVRGFSAFGPSTKFTKS